MSRCFPFPPPGYERKTKVDDPDLLKKEKQIEKQHKKEKKDKEKKAGKEKREKERSDEKHREKKDKKEKQRDKKKEKERDRDKDKHKGNIILANEKRVLGPPEGHVHKPSEKNKERGNDSNATLAKKRVAGLSAFHNGMPVSKNHLVSEIERDKYTPGLGRNSTDEKRTINQLPDKNISAEKKDGGVVTLAGRSAGPLVDGKNRTKEKPALDGRTDGWGVIGEARSSGGALGVNSVGMVQTRVGGIAGPAEKKIEQKIEGKEKIREKEGDGRKGDKRKDKDGEKSAFKGKDREKEKKKEEKMKATSEQKHIQLAAMKDGSENHLLKPSTKDGNKKGLSSAQSSGLQNIPKDSNHGAATVNNILGKRKDIGLNGVYDEHINGPNKKLARTTASAHPLAENGRSLEPCQSSTAFTPGAQRPPVNIKAERTFAPDDVPRPSDMHTKVDGKERSINGAVAQPFAQSSREMTVKAERKSDAPKPPHPDTKHLCHVLSVPKMNEWSDFDDQEWLFNRYSSQREKPEVELSGIDEKPQVWERALWLEPVDVYALPYVIPH